MKNGSTLKHSSSPSNFEARRSREAVILLKPSLWAHTIPLCFRVSNFMVIKGSESQNQQKEHGVSRQVPTQIGKNGKTSHRNEAKPRNPKQDTGFYIGGFSPYAWTSRKAQKQWTLYCL